MAKRGRKPNSERKGYFYEREEKAVLDYLSTEDMVEKNKIFNTILYPAFSKMIESIMRSYGLYTIDEDFTQTFSDTFSYLMSKISYYRETVFEYTEVFDDELINSINCEEIKEDVYKKVFKAATKDSPEYVIVKDIIGHKRLFKLTEQHYRAFSYCQTICKNYLLSKRKQSMADAKKKTSYDVVSDSFENDAKFSTADENSYKLAEKLIYETSKNIKTMIENPEVNGLNSDEIKVGYALCELLDNWEKLVTGRESNKLLKSDVLYFLREQTMMSTKVLRENMKAYKKLYYLLKTIEIQD